MTATLIDIPASWLHAGIMTLVRDWMGTDDGDPACLKPRGVLVVPALLNLRHSWPSHKIPPYRSSRRPQRNSSEGELRFHPARSSIFTMMIRRMAHYSDTPWLHQRCATWHRTFARSDLAVSASRLLLSARFHAHLIIRLAGRSAVALYARLLPVGADLAG